MSHRNCRRAENETRSPPVWSDPVAIARGGFALRGTCAEVRSLARVGGPIPPVRSPMVASLSTMALEVVSLDAGSLVLPGRMSNTRISCRSLGNLQNHRRMSKPVECRNLLNVESSRTQSRSPPAYTGSRGCYRGLFQEQVVCGGPTPLHLRLRWTVFIYGGARGYIPRRGVSGACLDKFQTPLPLSNLLVVVVVESPRRVVVESRRCRCRSSSLSNVAVECRCRRRILKPKIELEMQCPRYSPHLMVAVVRGGSPAACRGPTPRSCAMLWRPTPPVTSKVQLLHRGHGSIGETLSATAHRGAIPRPWNIWPIPGSNDMSDVWQGPFALDGVTLTSRIGVQPCVVVLLAGLSCC